MSKILVTGGAGFIPSHLIDALLENNHEVTSIDNFVTGKKDNLSKKENHTFIKADVNNLNEIEPILRKGNFEYIFHYAALVGVQRTLNNPIGVLNDLSGLENIFFLAKETKVKKIFFSSSSEVYGEPVELPQREYLTPLNSRLPYAVIKNVGECFCKSYKQEHNIDYTIFRFFNTYGLRQSKDFVVSKFIELAKDNKDITVYGTGLQTRTFCYIDDHIEATIKAFEDNVFNNEIVNIGNNEETTILHLAETIIKVLNSKSKIKHLNPLKEGDMTRRQPDIKRMQSLLGRDFTSLEKGLKKII
ncbi:MAG: epimerase [Candidatus Heimdallarchaeota archaeon]|nr:epimerase [Candidatus Heimdallarchaeota archaeon]